MKTEFILLLLMLVALSGMAQYGTLTDNQRNGAYVPGPSQPTPEQMAKERQGEKVRWSYGQPLRVVDKKIYNVLQNQLWQPMSGKVYEKDGDVLILDRGAFTYMAVKNYSGEALAEQYVNFVAMRAGTYDMGGRPIALWDCGTPYIPPPPTPEQIAAAKAKIAVERQKVLEGQTNAVHWLQSQATNGDASAQCSLGLHYLNGQGCETNKEQAIFWLQKAAAQGDMEAANKLSELKSP